MIHADIRGRVALITGAGSGIGLATAKLFAASGASLLINDLDPQRGAPALDACCEAAQGASCGEASTPDFVAGDMGDAAMPGRLVEHVIQRFGRLDFLVNNAATPGTATPIPFADLDALSDEFWHQLLEVNLIGPFRMTRAALPQLKASGGAVVNTASIAGLAGKASSIPYAASKAGLINVTRNLARAAAPDVRINAVAPGFIDSPWTRGWPADRWQTVTSDTLLKRAGQPEEVAEAILYLCAGGSFITAQTVVIDGGRGL